MATAQRTNRIGENGHQAEKRGSAKPEASRTQHKMIEIPPLQQGEITLLLVGDRPLMTSNKMNVAESIAEVYDESTGGKMGKPKKRALSHDEKYALAFYVMPSSKHPAPHQKAKYGIPASGIKKCFDAAIRQTGITDNTTISVIQKGFSVMADAGGLCEIQFDRVERDIRAVTPKNSSCPQMRHRPMFHGWTCRIRIKFNMAVLTPETLVNLGMHAGQYIGWGEMRAQKGQGECGGFVIECNG